MNKFGENEISNTNIQIINKINRNSLKNQVNFQKIK